jgi:LacI family transcriptional regulator
VSIDHVAAAAGVSTATVSRILNSPKLVAPETAARVHRVIEKLGYRPNRFAQGLMTKRSRVLGVMLPDIYGEFYLEVLRGASAQAHRRRYNLLIAADTVDADGAEPIATGASGLVDGLALMLTEPNEALWKRVRRAGLPLVALDADLSAEGIDSVMIDNTSGAGEAIAHLLGSVPPSSCYFVGGPRDNFDTVQRAAAFRRALTNAGHRLRPDQTAYGTYSPEWGRSWAAAIIKKRDERVLGIMAGDDEIALGVLDVFQKAGYAVPDEARIVGFDDSRLASLLRPALSSVRVPLAGVGAAAIDALIDRIEKPDAPAVRRTLPTHLVVRESSGVRSTGSPRRTAAGNTRNRPR